MEKGFKTKNSPKSLYSTCIKCLTDYLDILSVDLDKFLKEDISFHKYLPPLVSYDIINNRISKSIQLTDNQMLLRLLLFLNVDTRMLRCCADSEYNKNIDLILTLIEERCPNLEFLELSWILKNKQEKNILTSLPLVCTNLTKLTLTGNEFVNDDIMNLWPSTLIELDISLCHSVTDFGMRHLCGFKTKGCKNLQSLNIECTSISKYGIHMGLTYLRCLKKLQCNRRYLEKALVMLGLDITVSIEKAQLDMTVFDMTLGKVVKLCPYIKELDLQVQNIQLDELKLLSYLSSLAIRYDENHSSSVIYPPYSDLRDTLNSIGYQLEELTLQSIEGIDLCDVISSCPNLRYLNLANEGFTANSESFDENNHYNHLNCLSLYNFDASISDILLSVLSNASYLEVLDFSSVAAASDELFRNVLKENNFQYLKSISFYQSYKISATTIFNFINLKINLEDIFAIRCRLTDSDISMLKEYVIENNLNIKLVLLV